MKALVERDIIADVVRVWVRGDGGDGKRLLLIHEVTDSGHPVFEWAEWPEGERAKRPTFILPTAVWDALVSEREVRDDDAVRDARVTRDRLLALVERFAGVGP